MSGQRSMCWSKAGIVRRVRCSSHGHAIYNNIGLALMASCCHVALWWSCSSHVDRGWHSEVSTKDSMTGGYAS